MHNVTRRFRVTGKVQGVYFRQSTRIEAQRLSISGFARNDTDGSVAVLAQGAAPAVEELRRWLDRGPRAARVEQVIELDPAAELRAELERLESAGRFEVR